MKNWNGVLIPIPIFAQISSRKKTSSWLCGDVFSKKISIATVWRTNLDIPCIHRPRWSTNLPGPPFTEKRIKTRWGQLVFILSHGFCCDSWLVCFQRSGSWKPPETLAKVAFLGSKRRSCWRGNFAHGGKNAATKVVVNKVVNHPVWGGSFVGGKWLTFAV